MAEIGILLGFDDVSSKSPTSLEKERIAASPSQTSWPSADLSNTALGARNS